MKTFSLDTRDEQIHQLREKGVYKLVPREGFSYDCDEAQYHFAHQQIWQLSQQFHPFEYMSELCDTSSYQSRSGKG